MTYAYKGMIVLYRLTAGDEIDINRRRNHADQNRIKMREEKPGFQAHIGTLVEEGDSLPMIVARIGEMGGVSGQVFLNGNDTLWATNVPEGEEPGQWQPITNG